MKALARLHVCAVAPEPSLFAYAHAQPYSGARCRILDIWVVFLLILDLIQSPPTWERAADSVYHGHVSYLFTVATSGCDSFS